MAKKRFNVGNGDQRKTRLTRQLVAGLIASAFIFTTAPCLAKGAKLHGDADVPDKAITASYKANTVDDCILEKSCVWYAFYSSISVPETQRKRLDKSHIRDAANYPSGKALFHKWKSDVYVRVTLDARWTELPAAHEKITQLQPYFGFKLIEPDVSDPTQVHIPIILSVDFDHDMALVYRQFFSQLIGSDAIYKTYEKTIKGRNSNTCEMVSISNAETSDGLLHVPIINYKLFDADRCLTRHIYMSLGFVNVVRDKRFTLQRISHGTHPPTYEYTRLDKFLIYILYQPEFKNGMSLVDAEKVFNTVYDRALKGFVKIEKNATK